MLLVLLAACTASTNTGVRYVNGKAVAIDCHRPTGGYSVASCSTGGTVWVWTGFRCEPQKDMPPYGGCACSNWDCPYRFQSESECRSAYSACL